MIRKKGGAEKQAFRQHFSARRKEKYPEHERIQPLQKILFLLKNGESLSIKERAAAAAYEGVPRELKDTPPGPPEIRGRPDHQAEHQPAVRPARGAGPDAGGKRFPLQLRQSGETLHIVDGHQDLFRLSCLFPLRHAAENRLRVGMSASRLQSKGPEKLQRRRALRADLPQPVDRLLKTVRQSGIVRPAAAPVRHLPEKRQFETIRGHRRIRLVLFHRRRGDTYLKRSLRRAKTDTSEAHSRSKTAPVNEKGEDTRPPHKVFIREHGFRKRQKIPLGFGQDQQASPRRTAQRHLLHHRLLYPVIPHLGDIRRHRHRLLQSGRQQKFLHRQHGRARNGQPPVKGKEGCAFRIVRRNQVPESRAHEQPERLLRSLFRQGCERGEVLRLAFSGSPFRPADPDGDRNRLFPGIRYHQQMAVHGIPVTKSRHIHAEAKTHFPSRKLLELRNDPRMIRVELSPHAVRILRLQMKRRPDAPARLRLQPDLRFRNLYHVVFPLLRLKT